MIKIEEDKFNQLQKTLKTIAFSSLAIVFVLFIFVAWKGIRISEQIARDEQTIANNLSNIKQQEEQIKINANTINQQERDIEVAKDNQKLNEEIIERFKSKASPSVTKEVLKESNNLVSKVLEEKSVAVKPSARLIYIQIREKSQKESARILQKKLQEKGYDVPGIDEVGGKPSQISNLRYCKGKGQQVDIENIKGLVLNETKIKISNREISVKGCDQSSVGIYELWLEADFK